MIKTFYRRPDLPDTPAGLFDDGLTLIDALTGTVPTWRLDEEPLYLETLRDLGVPGLDEPAAPAGPVVVGHLDDEQPVEDDAPPTRALRLAPAPAPDECPDCRAVDPDPCRPKSDPIHGRPLTRQHRRRRALAEAGRGQVALVVLVLGLVLAAATGVGTFLAGTVDSISGPWDTRPCNGTTVCEPAP